MQSKKTKIYRYIFISLMIAWMGLIFFMSSRNAEKSTHDSNSVIMMIGRIFHSDFEEWDDVKVTEYLDSLSLVIRKTAHACEYAVLCFLAAHVFIPGTKNQLLCRFKKIFTGFAVAVMYAITDEIHQSFVPGRACTIVDVGIDSLGAFAMVLLMSLVLIIKTTQIRNDL